MKPAERLVVAADFTPIPGETTPDHVRRQVLNLADSLAGSGVYIKVNSALRMVGYGLIRSIKECGLKVFADLKICDVPCTMATDAEYMWQCTSDILTVMCGAGPLGIRRIKGELPSTELLGVTVLTSLTPLEVSGLYTGTILEVVERLASQTIASGLDGLVCSPWEVDVIRRVIPKSEYRTINTPNVRPAWISVHNDDQEPSRTMTPKQAIQAGADRIIVGRPITRPPAGFSSRDIVNSILDEIDGT